MDEDPIRKLGKEIGKGIKTEVNLGDLSKLLDAAEAALEGKVEKARQRFAQATLGATNLSILSLAFQFYYSTSDLDTAMDVGQRWQAATEAHSGERGVITRISGTCTSFVMSLMRLASYGLQQSVFFDELRSAKADLVRQRLSVIGT